MILTTKTHVNVTISGRDEHEEKHWWNPVLRNKIGRPGPGMIPTVLADKLHDPDHDLFSVLVSSPNVKPPAVHGTPFSSARTNTWAPPPPPPPPSDSEVRTAVPHPDAYYCPKENGWVILIWKNSSVSPPYARSFKESCHPPLPSEERRCRYESCLDKHTYPVPNITHHFHKYENAVDSHKLTQPLRMEEWEVKENVDDIKMADGDAEGILLDLYMCCQCSLYCVASGVIPGVIHRKCFDDLIEDKRANPLVGQTGEMAITTAFETLIRIIENSRWKGEKRLLRTDRTQFRDRLGLSPNIKRTMEALGFTEELFEEILVFRPPPTDLTSSIGLMSRRRLLRAWVEINAWLADFICFNDLPGGKVLSVRIESIRESYYTAIGAHPNQIPRGELSGEILQTVQLQGHNWRNLGLTPLSFSPELLAFAYYAQARCDPARTVEYFTSFSNIVQNLPDCPQSLLDILATERFRDRFTTEDLQQATTILGFGENNILGVEYNEAVPEQFLENAWRGCVNRSWREPGGGAEMLRNVNEAFRILAEARGSETLRRIWENGKNTRVMTPEKAYDTLEVPKDTDDFMLIIAYNMHMGESPSQIEKKKIKEAIAVIAESRDSKRLRQFLELLERDLSGQVDEPTRIPPVAATAREEVVQLLNTLDALEERIRTLKNHLNESIQQLEKLN